MSMIFRVPKLSTEDRQVLELIGKQKERLRYLSDSHPRRWKGLLSRNTLARAIQGSNSIEGYNVTMEDAIAAVQDEEPLDLKTESWRAIVGYREALTYIINLANDPYFDYHPQLIRSLHFMMLSYDIAKHPGQWRPGSVSVRKEDTGEVVYEGPDVEMVPGLIEDLMEQLQDGEADAIVRAAMAHLNLTMIHPFSDGNGRMARALQTLVIVRQGMAHPIFSSIEEWLGRNRQAYYDVLAEVGRGSWHPERDALPWIRFCLRAHYQQMTTLVKRDEEMRRVWEGVMKLIGQQKLPERADLALVDTAYGLRLTRPSYMASAEVTEFVASHDLKRLSDAGVVLPKGEKRGRYYLPSRQLRQIYESVKDDALSPDPYQLVDKTARRRQMSLPLAK
jgi:Fic family protein